jgi:predicted Zn-dependent protease
MRTRSSRFVLALLLAFTLVGSFACASSSGKSKRPKRTVLLTAADDTAAGKEGAEGVAAQIGVLDDPKLLEYIDGIGKKLLRGLPERRFAYHFAIVDQMEPNAFALPGGYIYISRGLLALANNEDELACVMAHEIVHVNRRHSAQQQAVQRYQSGGFFPSFSAGRTLAAYSRDMETEADTLGQQLAATAGYDPIGMSTFMRRLDQRERLLIGAPRAPTFYDTHPGSGDRASASAMRAGELRWTPDKSLGDLRARYLDHIDGMAIGDRPETGVFIDEFFLHPMMDFEIRFPKGWRAQNSATVVGAMAPRGEAAVYLTGDLPAGDLVTLADEFAAKAREEENVEVTEKKKVRVGRLDGVRYAFKSRGMGFPIEAVVTFFPFGGGTWRIVGVAPAMAANRYMGQILLTTRSFVPITPAHRAQIRTNVLRVVMARAGEDLATLGARTDNAWSPTDTALINGKLGNVTLEAGELMKILRSEPYTIPLPETGSEKAPEKS